MGRADRDRARHGGRSAGVADAEQGFQARLRGVRGEADARVQGRLMADRSFLAWPFFEPRHWELADKLEGWCAKLDDDETDVDSQCRTLVSELGSAGFLKLCVADGDRRP